jgi:hypothetical protein
MRIRSSTDKEGFIYDIKVEIVAHIIIHPNLLTLWKKQVLKMLPDIFFKR